MKEYKVWKPNIGENTPVRIIVSCYVCGGDVNVAIGGFVIIRTLEGGFEREQVICKGCNEPMHVIARRILEGRNANGT